MNVIKQPMLPDTIHFNHTIGNNPTEVMRITRNGIWVNPDMSIDDTAKAVLEALDYNIKVLVQRAVEDERAEKREWVGLTEEEAADCWSTSAVKTWQAIEAKLRSKNT